MNRTLTLVAAGLAACTPKNPEIVNPGVPSPASLDDGFVTRAEHDASAQAAGEALAHLAELELIVVSELIVDAPAASGFCYGPCAEEPVDQAWMQAHALQVARLQAFVQVADDARAASASLPFGEFDEAESVALLNQLQLVEVEAIDWETDGACYIGACPSDDARRAAVRHLVAGSSGL